MDSKEDEVLGLDEPVGAGPDENLKLVPTEADEKFTVPRKVAMMSELVKTMAEGGSVFSFSYLILL